MTSWKPVAFLILLTACESGLSAPTREAGAAATELTRDDQAASLVLSVPGQLVTIEGAGGAERAWVSAHLTVGTDRVPISDGAILAVSAADGPMPQVDPDNETLSIAVRSAVADAAGVVSFLGVATLATGRVVSPPFEITGTARPAPAPPAPPPPPPPPPPPSPNPDYIVWDIVGGNLLPAMSFTTRGVVRNKSDQ